MEVHAQIRGQELKSNVKEIRVGEADKLPYPNSFFDWVTCVGMLEYYPVEYAEVVLAEIRRVLKPNRKCFIEIPNPSSKEAQTREYIFKHSLKSFEVMVRRIGFRILDKNMAGWMLQYLLAC